MRTVPAGTVLVLGHPYVDVWQAVLPRALGIDAWPAVPKGTDWKDGVCDGLGWLGLARRRPSGKDALAALLVLAGVLLIVLH